MILTGLVVLSSKAALANYDYSSLHDYNNPGFLQHDYNHLNYDMSDQFRLGNYQQAYDNHFQNEVSSGNQSIFRVIRNNDSPTGSWLALANPLPGLFNYLRMLFASLFQIGNLNA